MNRRAPGATFGGMARLLLLALALAAAALSAGAPARGQGFDVPDGFATEIVRRGGLGDDDISVLRVRPAEGDFAGLSYVDLAPLPDAPGNPDAWLRDRVTARLDAVLPDPRTVLDGADSPFADPAFDGLRDTLAGWVEGVARLGELPLEFCDAPRWGENAAGRYRELRCALPVGPFRRHLALRLQQAGGIWYHVRAGAMNESRMPALLAIADSFRLDGEESAP